MCKIKKWPVSLKQKIILSFIHVVSIYIYNSIYHNLL